MKKMEKIERDIFRKWVNNDKIELVWEWESTSLVIGAILIELTVLLIPPTTESGDKIGIEAFMFNE